MKSSPNDDSNSIFLALPRDQVAIILSYLVLNDVLRLRAVSSHFRSSDADVGTATNHLWMDRDEEAEKILPNRRLHSYFSNLSRRRPIAITLKRMKLCNEAFPNVHTLRIIGLNMRTRHILSEVIENANLECLELLDTVEGELNWCNTNHSIRLNKMRKLTITGKLLDGKNPMLRCLLRACPKLTNLSLRGARYLSDHVVEEVILKPLSTTLISLSLNQSGGMVLPIIRSSILEKLHLAGSIDLIGLDPRSCCPSLIHLDMSDCVLLGETGWVSSDFRYNLLKRTPHHLPENCIFSGVGVAFCPRLQTLNLAGCMSIKSIQSSLMNINNTVHARLSNTDQLGSVNLSSCAELEIVSISSARLKELDLTDCNAVKKVTISSHILEEFEAPGKSLVAMYLNCQSLISLTVTSSEELKSKNLLLNCPLLSSIKGQGRDHCPLLKSINGQGQDTAPIELNQTKHTFSRWGLLTLPLCDYLVWREYNIRF